MGSDDLFKKRKKTREKRKYAFRQPKADSYLIVTEGTCTEPNYFTALKKRIVEKLGGNLNVVAAPDIDIYGEGTSTERLIEAADMYVSRANILYQNVWIVFDKDDFDDFDNAVSDAEQRGYKAAWGNQSFEYWLFLHFAYSDADLHRDEWVKKLDQLFREYGLSEDGYHKNMEHLYDKLESIDGIHTAIGNAKRRMADFNPLRDKPSKYAPGTMVYVLVEELIAYLE